MFPGKTNLPYLKESKEIGDLNAKSIPELKEILDRQNNLLRQKFLVSKLQDKGEKIKKVKERIENELQSRETPKIVSQENILNINAWEWRDSNENGKNFKTNINDNSISNDKGVLRILAENGNVHKPANTKFKNTPHIQKLFDSENEQKFSYKPYIAVVDKKLKKIIPEAHTEQQCSTSAKCINLPESMELLTNQFSTLKFIETTSRSKRAEECVEDRINESTLDNSDTENNDECITNN